jgi:hypothetical protein
MKIHTLHLVMTDLPLLLTLSEDPLVAALPKQVLSIGNCLLSNQLV